MQSMAMVSSGGESTILEEGMYYEPSKKGNMWCIQSIFETLIVDFPIDWILEGVEYVDTHDPDYFRHEMRAEI
jgi:hypothetical protein